MHQASPRLSLAGALLGCCLAFTFTTIACGTGTRGGGPTAGSGGSGGRAVSGTGGVNGTGGSLAGSGGGPATGGSAASGGSGGIAGSGGASSGGMSATGGGSAGASGTGGLAGQGGAGAGGTSDAGVGGGAGTAPKPPAVPSAGCGESAPEMGSSTSPLTVSDHQYYVKVPPSYDANKPYPMIFVFHGTGDGIRWGELNAGFEGRSAIRVYPGTTNLSGWGAGDVPFFMPLYEQLASHFCVDKARVFAAGSDSGGNFASILGCESASVLRGVAMSGTKEPRPGTPDGAYPLDATMRTCTGHVTAIVIYSPLDRNSGADGPTMRDLYRDLNHCGTETTGLRVSDLDASCFQYQGCDAGFPVDWCEHRNPTYADTYHGWPSFAGPLTWGIFSAY